MMEYCLRRIIDLDPKVRHAKESCEDMLITARRLEERMRMSWLKSASMMESRPCGEGCLKEEFKTLRARRGFKEKIRTSKTRAPQRRNQFLRAKDVSRRESGPR